MNNYKIPLSKPDITDSEKKAVDEVLETSCLCLGEKYKEFEKIMADFAGVKYAVAVNSGTSGLHLIVRALGIKEGDEVITTPFSFIASSNCILFEKAKPVFVDINEKTFNIDVSKIEEKITNLPAGKQEKLKAILAVDIFSQPADWQELKRIAKKHKLFLIEDSAEALGSEQNGEKCGSFGDAAIFAFYPNKQITSVRYDTPVLVRKDGIIKLVKIGSLMDFMIDDYWEPEGYECLSFDKDGKISWQKINAFIKHDLHSEILRVKLEKGREVEITKSHSVFAIKDNEIREVLGRNLKVGDFLVVPRKLPAPENIIEEIDILDYINRDYIKYNKEEIIIKNNCIGGGGGKYINRKVKVDKDFCKLLGYFIAEGGYDMDKSGGGLRFTFGLHEKNTFVKEVKNIFSSVWPNFKAVIVENEEGHRCTVLCGGLLHSNLFKNLGCGKNVYEKDIPNIIWDTTNENKLAFIEGLLNGDGHERIVNGSRSRKIKVASENLVNGLHYLLLTMGIQSRLEREDYFSKKGKLCHSYACEILGDGEQATAKENCIPISFLSLNDESSHIQKNRINYKNSISVETIKTWLVQKQVNCPNFLLEDIAVLRIKEIEKEKFHEFVYDLEVKGFENFVGGYGAICLHNTGEGGMVLTDNKKICELCRSMANQGRKIENGKWLKHVRLGYNYRLDEMSCALGIAQMKRIKEILKKRARVAELYNKKLREIKELEIPYIKPGNKLSWFVYVVKLNRKLSGKRDIIIEEMEKRGIQCGNYFQAIHLQPFYREKFGYKKEDFPVAENVSQRTLALPFFNNLKEEEIDFVVKNLKEIISNV